jgi:hypothetical protein
MWNLDSLSDQGFFNKLIPSLEIGLLKSFKENQSLLFCEETMKREQQRLDFDGHFIFKNTLKMDTLKKLKKAILILEENNLPAIFISLYDEFWQLVHDLNPIGSGLLGEDYMIFPDFWVWNVDHKKQSSGWRPHRESIVESSDSSYPTKSISLWISLTEATTENGCMYILPKSKDRGYPSSIVFDINTLQDVKALPVPAGSIIGWNQSVFHWGSSNSRLACDSRMSFAMELRKVSDRDEIPFMIASHKVPSFNERVHLVAMQFVNYKHLHSENQTMMNFSDSILGSDYDPK